MMKKTIAAIILAALAATPAMAQRHVQRAPIAANGYATDASAYGTYAYDTPVASGVVVRNGMYAGADPDADVRLQLENQADNIYNR
jgi:opacity protein-like surface antigen